MLNNVVKANNRNTYPMSIIKHEKECPKEIQQSVYAPPEVENGSRRARNGISEKNPANDDLITADAAREEFVFGLKG